MPDAWLGKGSLSSSGLQFNCPNSGQSIEADREGLYQRTQFSGTTWSPITLLIHTDVHIIITKMQTGNLSTTSENGFDL